LREAATAPKGCTAGEPITVVRSIEVLELHEASNEEDTSRFIVGRLRTVRSPCVDRVYEPFPARRQRYFSDLACRRPGRPYPIQVS